MSRQIIQQTIKIISLLRSFAQIASALTKWLAEANEFDMVR